MSLLKRPKSLTEQAAEEIRQRIVSGRFDLGAPISENALAAELGVSKTPIREALLQLRMEGLVSIQPQRGSFVFDMTAEEIVELGELRETLELAALDLAARRQRMKLLTELTAIVTEMSKAIEAGTEAVYRKLDADFHATFFERCGNRFFQSCYQSFAFRVQALRVHLSTDIELNRRSFAEHSHIVEMIARNEMPSARALLSRHVQQTITTYVTSRGTRSGETAA